MQGKNHNKSLRTKNKYFAVQATKEMEGYSKQDILCTTETSKWYHQDAITTLTNEINNLEARLCRNSGLAENLEGIKENI